jgi:hypothetical protein
VNVPKLSSKFYIARSDWEEREREREKERERERESIAVLPSQSKIKLPKRSNIS